MTVLPAVSIILPTYDRLEYLKEAVESVLAQTFADWELIVVDDGSSDGTVAWLESLAEPRVAVVREPHTGNRSSVRNRGVSRARADWIAFLDSDDLWHPDKLRLQLAQLEAHPNRRWSCTGVRFIDAEGASISQRAGVPYQAQSGWILERLLTFTAAATLPTLIVHRSLLDEAGGFDEAFLVNEDFELELRLAERSEIHALADALTTVRHHAGRTSSQARIADLYRGTAKVFRKMALTTANKRVRDISRHQCARCLSQTANALSLDGAHGAALAWTMRAIREAPLNRAVWSSVLRCVVRWFR